MRYFYVLICCCFLTSVFAQSDYLPMLQEGARWNEYYSVGNPPCNYTFEIVGDTIFNEKIYQKIEETTYCGFFTDIGQARFLREDTLERKVYESFGAEFGEEAIYDFSLSPGDTFFYSLNRHFIVLDSISTVITNNFFCGIPENNIPEINIKNPRIFYFETHLGGIVWIEGIGSLAGLFSYNVGWTGGFGQSTLLCHSNRKKGELFHYVFCDEPAPCRARGRNVVNNINVTSQIDIAFFPNPVDDYLRLESTDSMLLRSRYTIYNMNGKLCDSQPIVMDGRILVNHLPAGIYFLKIAIADNSFFTHKFIKL